MHTNFTYRLRAGLVALALGLGLVVGLWHSRADAQDWPPPQRGDNCTEDMECWDCETMGNRICGPIPVPADPEYTG